jgi:HTH-type transcriptional regulator/antitoxin HipB
LKLINSEIMEKKLKKYSLDEIKDEFIGKKGTTEREQYEYDLQMDVFRRAY